MKNLAVWFDIPVVDLDRAITFYSAVVAPLTKQQIGKFTIAVFPHGEAGGGCLAQMDDDKPSAQGPLIYLSVEGRLDAALTAVTANGGKILKPKESIAPHGFRAIVLDCEGNRIALHSM